MKRLFKSLCLFAAVALTASVFTACQDEPDKYEISGGTPIIRYIRPVNAESADSILTGAYMDNNICIVGENLRSITKMFFNDNTDVIVHVGTCQERVGTLNIHRAYIADSWCTIADLILVRLILAGSKDCREGQGTQQEETIDYSFHIYKL